MPHSISDESLRRFTAGTTSLEEGRAILAHLLAKCPVCTERLRTLAGLEPPPASVYERPLDRFEDRLRQALRRPVALQASPEALLEELDRLPAAQQEILARNSARYRDPELCGLLVQRCFDLRYENPDRCVHYGRLAVLIARRLVPDSPVERVHVNDLCVRSFALFANALRIRGDLDEAEAAMMAAHQLLAAGGASPTVEAIVYELSGSLRLYQRRYGEAVELYGRSIDLHRHSSEPTFLARALVGQAIATSYAGDPASARALLWEAIPRIGPGHPKLTLAACHALIDCEIELGRVEEATLLWAEARPLYDKLGDCLVRIRQGWLEGKLLIAQGILPEGLRRMEAAHRQYVSKGLRYDAAVLSLEMAPGYLKLGRRAEAKRLMMQAVPVFQSLGIRRELLGAMILLEQCRRRDVRRSH